jgi:hypothetical protein
MEVKGVVTQKDEVVELALEDIEIVSGGFPVIPPLKPGG